MKISDCRKLKVHSPKPTGSVIPQFTNRPGSPHDRPGTNIHPTGLFCSASYVTRTPAYPLSILSCRHWNPTDMKRFFYNAFIHLRIFQFLLLNHVPSPNFNHGCEDLARKKHFVSDKNRPGLALDRSGF